MKQRNNPLLVIWKSFRKRGGRRMDWKATMFEDVLTVYTAPGK